ncbi:MAG TPA: hypothetical protein PLC25_02680 [Bacilli bacterium]|nr:hypothetical protein [Bacilli bacterium]
MKNDIEAKINTITNNIKVLPLTTKKDKQKYIEYIDSNLKEFTSLKNSTFKEINNRYHAIIDVKEKDLIKELEQHKLDVNYIRLFDKSIDIYDASGIDILLYKLSKYYKDDLDNVNNVIMKIITLFATFGINLTIKDFNYTSYVTEYMKVLLIDNNTKEKIHTTIDNIYWKCPDLLKEIELNFKYLFLKNKKKLTSNLKNIKDESNQVLSKYYNEQAELNNLITSDYAYHIRLFREKTLNVNDFKESNIDKLKHNLELSDANACNASYNNLEDLLANIQEYSNYLKFKFIIDDITELFKDKETYKGLYDNKLKEIKKNEKTLFSCNSKLLSKGLLKLNDSKEEIVLGQEKELIKTLYSLYQDLDDLLIKEDIYKYIDINSSIYDVFKVVSNNYEYFLKLLKKDDENITIDDIETKMYDLRYYLLTDNLNIISNTKIGGNAYLSRVISDRYKLACINVTEEDLDPDNIEKTIENIKTLMVYHDISNLNLNYETIKFVLDAEKIIEGVNK